MRVVLLKPQQVIEEGAHFCYLFSRNKFRAQLSAQIRLPSIIGFSSQRPSVLLCVSENTEECLPYFPMFLLSTILLSVSSYLMFSVLIWYLLFLSHYR